MSIRACPLPQASLLARYAAAGAYTDCYATDLPAPVTQAEFVQAFYSGAVFKLERLLIRLFLARPSTDAQVRQLAAGELHEFAAWRVEDRTPTELLLCDLAGRTRSWLMVSAHGPGTRLHFGSAVVPVRDRASGEARMGIVFKALLGFHKLYSRVLLAAARRRLLNPHSRTGA